MSDHALLTLDLVAMHADIPTTIHLLSVHSAITVRADVDYHAYRMLTRYWSVWTRAARSRSQRRVRRNSWRPSRSKNFDENAPLLVYG